MAGGFGEGVTVGEGVAVEPGLLEVGSTVWVVGSTDPVDVGLTAWVVGSTVPVDVGSAAWVVGSTVPVDVGSAAWVVVAGSIVPVVDLPELGPARPADDSNISRLVIEMERKLNRIDLSITRYLLT